MQLTNIVKIQWIERVAVDTEDVFELNISKGISTRVGVIRITKVIPRHVLL